MLPYWKVPTKAQRHYVSLGNYITNKELKLLSAGIDHLPLPGEFEYNPPDPYFMKRRIPTNMPPYFCNLHIFNASLSGTGRPFDANNPIPQLVSTYDS